MTPPVVREADLAVLGGGPGGYTAAFRAADLGRSVILVEREAVLGGVCLNVGCIPSKALLHVAGVLEEVRALQDSGIAFGPPAIDLARLRARKDEVVATLNRGLAQLAQKRRVERVTGTGRFVGPHELEVSTGDGPLRVRFGSAIVAVGSEPVRLPGLPEDPRIVDSTGALALPDLPRRLLVIGGGVIGLELAAVYAALGSEITVVEAERQLLTGVDPDLVRPLQRRIEKRYAAVLTATRVAEVEARADALHVRFEGQRAPSASEPFDRILVAVGRRASGGSIGAEAAGLEVDGRGVIAVDRQQRTQVPHLYAIGDVVGPPFLAHKATHQGKVAAECAAGLASAFDARAIPNVAYTDPEIAWMGLTESEAAAQGRAVEKAVFPWSASGRALGSGRSEGQTKLLFSKDDGRLVGAGIVGPHAGELIAETVLALELGADAHDLALTIHPHPTLSETVAMAAELAAGTITDLLAPRPRPAPAR
ncbi:MAG TPA: dihydrolipoyl dehydrogenase [Myxococcota bacterium]|jgi:dihydrolipoamide dehydrogenase|nr:dihydrolipoyl dehydrogenase [Myxococcota bacterium]